MPFCYGLIQALWRASFPFGGAIAGLLLRCVDGQNGGILRCILFGFSCGLFLLWSNRKTKAMPDRARMENP